MHFKVLREDEQVKPVSLINGCYEIYANQSFTIPPQSMQKIRTGIRMEFPEEYFAHIQYRTKELVTLGGVVDSDYRGEFLVMLYNLTNQPRVINKDEKCADITFYEIMHLKMVEE